MNVQSICQVLHRIAPLELAEDWDNVGLLVGDPAAEVGKVLTCLTVTSEVVFEAQAAGVGLLVSHHPLPFQSLKKITSETVSGGLLCRLIAAKIAVYSSHTAYDSAAGGINDQWCDRLEMRNRNVLVPIPGAAPDAGLRGAGRCGELASATTAGRLLQRAAACVGATRPRMTGPIGRRVSRVAIACGSGGSFVSAAKRRDCDALLTGEATYHQCLEAEALGVSLLMVGHFASERLGVERMAECLSMALPGVRVGASVADRDPITVDPISQNT